MNLYCALVHHPVRARDGSTIATAVTNLDVHDIARSARVYDLRGYFVVTPITAQREIVLRIVEHWLHGEGARRLPERTDALSLVSIAQSVDEVVATIEGREGRAPRLVATAARRFAGRPIATYAEEARRLLDSSVPTLLLFGTGHGLADDLLDRVDALLEPIRSAADYNHLSVRAAVAITLDRLVGERTDPTEPHP